jgi:enoyl-CoA hydratase/carnithine racemase
LLVERQGARGGAPGETELWTIHRPEVRNAVDFATFDALLAATARAARNPALRAVVLTGAGTTFVSGGDLRELRELLSHRDATRIAETGRRACDALRSLQVPVIAALPGPAIGGGAELAVACDVRIADPSARLSFKHARMAVTTAWGTLPKLVSMVGHATASRLLLAGHELDAAEALRVGLIDAIAEPDRLLETAMAWASDIAKGAPGAVAGLKALLRETIDVPPRASKAANRDADRIQRAHELKLFQQAWAGRDHHEAVEAFFAGRPPSWGVGAEVNAPKARKADKPKSRQNK